MMIYLDVDAREATLLAAYYHPQQMKAVSQGNLQVLDNDGRALVGWGHNAAFTEFSSDGQVLCNVHFGASVFFGFGRAVSYRVIKGDWVGRPQTAPDAEVIGNRIYVSWNGATEVAAWQLETWLSGELEGAAFKVVAQYEKNGFETEIEIPENLDSPLFRLAALDANGNVLDVTELLQRERGSAMERLLNMHYWILGIAFVMSGIGLFLGSAGAAASIPDSVAGAIGLPSTRWWLSAILTRIGKQSEGVDQFDRCQRTTVMGAMATWRYFLNL
ncbi:hypothetical protein ASPACDRAFT_1892195 [Aspergillus aculeatus ATCC 16872]|uniref:Uncharacterized protein n=1 Tax=Aspergillus aculeatus (strain ATCC 16872 / CBS 172.66 / WB 5094) TaxID=690307 RepID=A0A1L9WF57_ASPA1|nr:uncharacterized protein ASPACDRAFT_1892195 [Aspergillus aculeatus ATCC 16872]OJJ94799.1 hypothetical protein ASPACDRAFT_1892195 [Aspergillus aculeatus ATCC 16872]